MLAESGGIVGVMVEKALDGDSGVAHWILGRVLPALRSAYEKVRFPFDATAQAPSPLDVAYGNAVAFCAGLQDGVDAGDLDRQGMIGIIAAITRWGPEGVWAA